MKLHQCELELSKTMGQCSGTGGRFWFNQPEQKESFLKKIKTKIIIIQLPNEIKLSLKFF